MKGVCFAWDAVVREWVLIYANSSWTGWKTIHGVTMTTWHVGVQGCVCVCVCVVKQCVSRSAPLSLSFPPLLVILLSFSPVSNGGSFQTVCSAVGYRGLSSDDRTVHMHNYALIPAALWWCFRLASAIKASFFPFAMFVHRNSVEWTNTRDTRLVNTDGLQKV